MATTPHTQKQITRAPTDRDAITEQVLEKENTALRRELRTLKESQEHEAKYRRSVGVERELDDATEEIAVLRRHLDTLKEELLESQRRSNASMRAVEDSKNWRRDVARELVARAEEKIQVRRSMLWGGCGECFLGGCVCFVSVFFVFFCLFVRCNESLFFCICLWVVGVLLTGSLDGRTQTRTSSTFVHMRSHKLVRETQHFSYPYTYAPRIHTRNIRSCNDSCNSSGTSTRLRKQSSQHISGNSDAHTSRWRPKSALNGAEHVGCPTHWLAGKSLWGCHAAEVAALCATDRHRVQMPAG